VRRYPRRVQIARRILGQDAGPRRNGGAHGHGAPDTTRVWDLRTDFRQTTPDVVTLSQLFQRNGYFTARSGKIYHYNNPSEIGTPGFDDPASWQQVSYPAGFDRTHDEGLVQFFARSGGEGGRAGRGRGAAAGPGAAGRQGRGGRGSAPTPDNRLVEAAWRYGGTGPSGTIRISQDGCTPTFRSARTAISGWRSRAIHRKAPTKSSPTTWSPKRPSR
jgi:hypothetical protein